MIEGKHIRKSFGKNRVLRDVSFSVEAGECLAIVGKNGCGKSTLLQILAGAEDADAGELYLFGKNATKKKERRIYCGYVPQENPLMEELSVRDNLRLWAGRDKERTREVVAEFELEELLAKRAGTLSGGMKRRLSIACAALHLPPVILLDEPTAGLDIYHKEKIADWMRQHLAKNGIIVMATHDRAEIAQADRCLLLRDGFLTPVEKEELRQAVL